MTPLRSEKNLQRPPRLEAAFIKMLILSVLLHLLLVALYVSPVFQRRPVVQPPVYRVNLVNAPVLNPQAGRPEAAPQKPVAPEPVAPPPVPEPIPEPVSVPEPESISEPEPVPEPEPELIPGPTPEELERERLAAERRQREEAERKRQLAEDQRKREEAERQKRLAEEQRKREEAERQKRLAEEQRQKNEREQLEKRLAEIAAQRQREEDDRLRQQRLDDLRAAARTESQQVESPIPDAPVGMPDGRGTEAGVSPNAFVREFIRQNWTFARHLAIGNPEAEVYLVYNAAGTLLNHRFVKRSGHAAFDESLVRALAQSRQLPQPLPQTMEFTIIFNLKEMLDR